MHIFDYCFGELEYRTICFETEILDTDNYQGNAVVNYTEYEVPYTRIIEHKHFEFGTQEKTVISREYPVTWKKGDEPYYPVNDEKNTALYAKIQRAGREGRERNLLRAPGTLPLYGYASCSGCGVTGCKRRNEINDNEVRNRVSSKEDNECKRRRKYYEMEAVSFKNNDTGGGYCEQYAGRSWN